MPFEHIQGSEDSDALFFRQMEQYVLEHYPNPSRNGCPNKDVLRGLVYDPESVAARDSVNLHVMECAECLREVIAFRSERQNAPRVPRSADLPPLQLPPIHIHRRAHLLTLGAVGIGCLVGGLAIGTHLRQTAPPVEMRRSQVVDLSQDVAPRGKSNKASLRLMRDVDQLVLELPPLSPAGRYEVTLQTDHGDTALSSAGTAQLSDGRVELPVFLNLTAVRPGTYSLNIQAEQDSAPYSYSVQLR